MGLRLGEEIGGIGQEAGGGDEGVAAGFLVEEIEEGLADLGGGHGGNYEL